MITQNYSQLLRVCDSQWYEFTWISKKFAQSLIPSEQLGHNVCVYTHTQVLVVRNTPTMSQSVHILKWKCTFSKGTFPANSFEDYPSLVLGHCRLYPTNSVIWTWLKYFCQYLPKFWFCSYHARHNMMIKAIVTKDG